MACVALTDINSIAWGLIIFLTADLADPVSCASLCHLLMAQNCCFYLNGSLAPHPIPAPLLPTHPYIDEIHDITEMEKTTSKTRSIYIACRISYEI